MGNDTKQPYDLVKTAGMRILIELNRLSNEICKAVPDKGLERHKATELRERMLAARPAVADLVTFADGKLR